MEEVSFIDNILLNHPTVISTSIAAIVAFFVAVIGISKQRTTAREKNSIEFEFNHQYNTKLIDALNKLKELLGEHGEEKLIEMVKDKSSEERVSILIILNEWERCANGISHRIYDEYFLYKVYGSLVIKIYEVLSPFVRHLQVSNPRVLVNFVQLSVRWKIRRTEENKKNLSSRLQDVQKELHTSFRNLQHKQTRHKEATGMSKIYHKKELSDLKYCKLQFKKTLKKIQNNMYFK